MQTLDLRGRTPAELPAPEEPPGLERVKRWVAPIGRFFHGVRLWVRYLWDATRGFRKEAGPAIARAARATGRFAVRGERRARAGAAFLRAVSRSGVRLQNTGRNWSRAEGRLGRNGVRMDRAGAWIENGAAGAAEMLLGFAEAARELKRLRRESPGSDDTDGRFLPRAPSAPAAPPGSAPVESAPVESAPVEPEPSEGAAGEPAASRSRPPECSPAAESPSPEVEPLPPEAVAPAVAPPEAAPPEASPPEPAPPAGERGGAAPPSRRRPRRQSRPDPPDDLPYALRGAIRALRERPPQEQTRSLILEICAVREWVRPAELARWLGVGAANLTKRHLGPLTERGLLERRYPESPRHRYQAYRTAKAPPPTGVAPEGEET